MTQPIRHFLTSASGGLPVVFAVGLGMMAGLSSTTTFAQQANSETILNLGGAHYTVISDSPSLGAVSVSGNVSSVMYTEPAETAIQRVYASLYLHQKELDSDMVKILHASLPSLYEE